MDEIIMNLKTALIRMNGLAMGCVDDYLPLLKETAQIIHDSITQMEEMTNGEGDG